MIQVWHDRKPLFGFGDGTAKFPEDYVHVADVDTDSLDVAFERTNNVTGPWWDNEHVYAMEAGILAKGLRSTSVGDIAVHNDTVYLCYPVGWRQVEGEDMPQKSLSGGIMTCPRFVVQKQNHKYPPQRHCHCG